MASRRDLTVKQVAQEIQVEPKTVRKWIKAGLLMSYHLPDNSYRITPEWLREFKRLLVVKPGSASAADELGEMK